MGKIQIQGFISDILRTIAAETPTEEEEGKNC